MGTIHPTTQAAMLGIALSLFTIPFLFTMMSGPRLQADDPLATLEFTDARVVRLDPSIPSSNADVVQRITIDADVHFLWCDTDSYAPSPCFLPLWNEEHAPLWKHMMTQQNIPSL